MRRLITILVFWLALVLPAECTTPTHDVSTASTCASTTNTVTFSHTVAADANLILVWVVNRVEPAATVSTLTYAGATLTFLAGVTESTSNPDVRTELWYKKAPATGANNVVITLSGSASQLFGGASSYKNVDQGTTFGTAATNTGQSTAPSVTVTSAAGEFVVDGMGQDGFTATVDGSQVERLNTLGCGNNLGVAISTEAGAASVVMSWSLSSSGNWASVGVSLKPLVSATPALLMSRRRRT